MTLPTGTSANSVLPHSHLSYVGRRSYIRGADLLVNFLDGAEAAGLAGPDARVQLLRLVRQIERDGAWQTDASPDAVATLDLKLSNSDVRRFHFIETRERITRRTPDAPSHLVRLEMSEDFSGSAMLGPVKDAAELLDALVETNKRWHEITLQARGKATDMIRLLYLEGFPLHVPPQSAPHRAELKLLAERERQGRHFTIVRITGAWGEPPIVLCYSTS